jgi:hypothetical protein
MPTALRRATISLAVRGGVGVGLAVAVIVAGAVCRAVLATDALAPSEFTADGEVLPEQAANASTAIPMMIAMVKDFMLRAHVDACCGDRVPPTSL